MRKRHQHPRTPLPLIARTRRQRSTKPGTAYRHIIAELRGFRTVFALHATKGYRVFRP